jgi:hypothetical protein
MAFVQELVRLLPHDAWRGDYPQELLSVFESKEQRERKQPEQRSARLSPPASMATPANYASPRMPLYEPEIRADQAIASLRCTRLLSCAQVRGPFDPETSAWLNANKWPSFVGQSV